MVSKDQAIGGLIFIVCAVVAVLYLLTLFWPQWLNVFAANFAETHDVQFWVIAVPVFVAFIAVMAIGAWIGWTMATTPPPKPIEEITSEIEKKEEPTTPQPEETKPPEEPVEEKKVERKKKS